LPPKYLNKLPPLLYYYFIRESSQVITKTIITFLVLIKEYIF